jgi:hypothetical protein
VSHTPARPNVLVGLCVAAHEAPEPIATDPKVAAAHLLRSLEVAHDSGAVDSKSLCQLIDRESRQSGVDQLFDLSLGQPDLALWDGAGLHHLMPSRVDYLSSFDVALVRVLSS